MNYPFSKYFLHRKTKRPQIFMLSFIAIIAVVSFVGATAFDASVTNASSKSMSVVGDAWSPNIGWISFSGNTGSQNGAYGVYENPKTGVLSGDAWNAYSQPGNTESGLGWLQFGSSDVNHPAAKVDFNNGGKITGFARFASAGSGSWGSPASGWVSFSGTASNGSSYKVVQKANCAWSGYAWEPDVAGWIQVSGNTQSGTGYGVQGTKSSVCSQISPSQQQLTCGVSKSSTKITFTASPGTLSSYVWRLNGASKSNNTSSLTVTPVAGASYVAQVSASVNGTPQTVYCPSVTIPTTSGNSSNGNGGGNGGGSSTITGTITAYPNRVRENSQTNIKFTWALNNVKSTDTCIFSKGDVGSVMPPIGGNVLKKYHVTGAGGNISNLLPGSRGPVTKDSMISDTIKTQTEYYIECNGVRVAGSAIVNVVPSFSDF